MTKKTTLNSGTKLTISKGRVLFYDPDTKNFNHSPSLHNELLKFLRQGPEIGTGRLGLSDPQPVSHKIVRDVP